MQKYDDWLNIGIADLQAHDLDMIGSQSDQIIKSCLTCENFAQWTK